MHGFGFIETAIMNRLWARAAPTSVRELHDDLRLGHEWAYTTVLTVVNNLFKKGWLRREPDGRAFRYTPVTSRGEYAARLMRAALDEAGDPADALASFVGQMSPEQTAALREVLAASASAPLIASGGKP